MRKLFAFLPAVLLLLLFLVGCGSDFGSSPNPGGGLGVTPGGGQDFSYIRTIIQNGGVPDPDYIHAEGLFSEYDLPVDGPAARKLIDIRTASGHAARHGLDDCGMYLQVGFSSTIAPEQFTREPLNLCIVLDRSGSMDESAGHGGMSKIAMVKNAVLALIDQLHEDDIVSMVIFNHISEVLFEPGSPSRDEIPLRISSLSATGSTDMDSGMDLGYDQIMGASDFDHNDWMFLLTDALPNTGDTNPGGFRALVEMGADRQIGLTAFGVGINFDQQLIDFFATVRRTNYYYLTDPETSAELFMDELDYMVTPVAFDVNFEIQPSPSFTLEEAYGFPGPQAGLAALHVATLFLSARSGATLLRFEPVNCYEDPIPAGTAIADLSLEYTLADNSIESVSLSEAWEGETISSEETEDFEQYGVHRATVLARFTSVLKQACTQYYYGNLSEAVSLLENLAAYLDGQAAVFPEEQYSQDMQLIGTLISTINGGGE